ncbi:energy transducer TonB family protein [Methylobacterium sp. CM6246]
MRLRLVLAILAIGMAYQALAVDGVTDPLRQWTGEISAAIQRQMNPQAAAGTRGGTVVIRFTVLRSGDVRDVSLARSSGVDEIDIAALAAVRGSLPVAPAGVTQQSLTVSMPLNYRVRQPASGSINNDLLPSTGGSGEKPEQVQNLEGTIQKSFVGPDIPKFDVDRECASYIQPDHIRLCVDLEQMAYNNLKTVWNSSSVSARNSAIKSASDAMNSKAYYQVLYEYVLLEIRLEEQRHPKAPPQFRR